MKEQIEQQVSTGFYTSVSEFIRSAVRVMLNPSPGIIPYGPGFSPEAEEAIRRSEQEALGNRGKNTVLKTPKDLDRFFDSLQ